MVFWSLGIFLIERNFVEVIILMKTSHGGEQNPLKRIGMTIWQSL